MCFVVFRVGVFATLLLISPVRCLMVTPALFCTFKQLPPSAVIKLPPSPNSSFFKRDLGDCMEMCYEDPACVYVMSYKDGLCTFNPSEGEAIAVSAITDFQGNYGVAFQLDRNEAVMECPTLEEWLQQNR